MSKHTPGPWRNEYPRIYSRDGAKLLEVDEYMCCTAYDASLIAAAPDLLDAAQKALAECCDLIGTEAGDALAAAIAKATGGN